MDSIGDFLSRIRNALRVGKPIVVTPYSGINFNIAQVLQKEGFIRDVNVIELAGFKKLEIHLKYEDDESVIHVIKRVSTPGRRRYAGANNVDPVIGKFGISILTTNKGVMTDKQARSLSIGGEIICSVW